MNTTDRPTRRHTGRHVAVIAIVATWAGVAKTAHAGAWPGCKAFTNQPTAQATWEAAGKPPNADRDGDGKVCESLPAPAAPAEQTPSSPRRDACTRGAGARARDRDQPSQSAAGSPRPAPGPHRGAMDGRDQALAIATDYAEQAQVARRPLVCTPQPADDRERQAVAA